MRIAIIVNSFPIVSETFILQQVQGALARGCEVDIYARPIMSGQPLHPVYREWKMEEHIRRRPETGFRSFRESIETLRTNIAPALRRPGLAARCLLNSLKQRDGNPIGLFQAALSVKENSPAYSVIHAHYAECGLLAVRLRALGIFRGPILTSFHGIDVTRRRSARRLRGLQQLFAEGDGFTHPSDYLGRRARALGCPEGRQRKLYYGVDTATFEFSPRTLAPGEPVRIISVARLVEKKGLSYAITAVAGLIRAGLNIEYNIIGYGALQDSLAAQINELGVESRIHLLGPQESGSVRRYLRDAHIFLLPSITASDGDMEGLPVSILEAQMCGLPVIATLHSGIPEGVRPGESAFLVKERDPAALEERLGYLATHPDLWPSMGRSGRQYVETHFDIELLNNELIGIYQALSAECGDGSQTKTNGSSTLCPLKKT